MIKQISVFVENRKGKIMEMLKTLADAKINIKAFSLADASDYGIARMVVDSPEKAKKVLNDDGVVMSINDVVAIGVPDEPGALMKTFSILCDNDIEVEYMYAFAEKYNDLSVIALRVDKQELAFDMLKSNGIYVMSPEEVDEM